jgi:hypothetical protein
MADSVYQPIVSDSDTESETPPASELSIVDPAEFRRQRLDDQERDDLTVEDAAAQHRRRPDPESPEDASQRPIVKHVVKGDGPISLNEAADAMRWGRGYKLGQELATSGLSQSQVEAMAADAVERGERIDPLAPPPPEVKVLEEFGNEKQTLTPAEAADELTNWRQRHAEAQQAELQELAGEAQQRLEVVDRLAEVQAQPQQQPPQAQPTPEQTERQQLAQERQRLAFLKRSEGIEVAERVAYDQLRNQVVAEFPSLRTALPSPAEVEDLRQRDPARFQRLAQFDQAMRQRQSRIVSLAQQREQNERQQAQADAQQRAAARAEEDAAFERLAAQHIPNWQTVSGQVRAQARTTLENAGLSKEQLHYLWNGDHSIDIHSAVLQLMVAKAASWDLASEKARQVRQSNLPQVIKPGTYRAPDSGEGSVRELQARLRGASGREALRLATELTKARRASGD